MVIVQLLVPMHVDYGAMQSDHIPVICYLNLQLAADLELGKLNDVTSGRVEWAVLSDEVIHNYSAQTDLLLGNYRMMLFYVRIAAVLM